MCGIIGIWDSNRPKEVLAAELEEAVSRLNHRGPDSRGTWINDAGVALGHTRLAIVDLSPGGNQPMRSADGRFVIVYNGEIYNYAELRARLESGGRKFISRSDTEAILHAFDEWGSDAVDHFVGMFAIAIWDEHLQVLELVRDRIGVKPLYWSWHQGVCSFSSELKALRAFSHWSPQVDRVAIGEFVQFGYISDDRSIYEGIRKLRPGHRVRFRRGQPPRVERYWSVLDRAIGSEEGRSDAQIESDLESLLISSAKYRMVADVPVGVFLSGGIDSSLVTALLAKHHSRTLNTFTIGFAQNSHNESNWARQVAEHCGTRHTEYILDGSEALAIARNWGSLFDEPFGDSSGIPTLLVSRLASREVKVVLSADGGDELFSGYKAYASVLDGVERLRKVPGVARRMLAAGLSLVVVPRKRRRHLSRLESKLREPTVGKLFELSKSSLSEAEIDRLIGEYQSPRNRADAYPGSDATRIALWDFHHYLPEDILTKVDRTTMAVSIEGREPLLDHRLAEFAFQMPEHLKRGPLGSKHLLKKILFRYVPRDLVDRPKQGFAVPLSQWLQNELKELVMDYLSDARIRAAGIFDPTLVQELAQDFYAGDRRLMTPMWYLVAFEMWRDSWLRH